ncbi:leucyl/phenylalanyl-tRNA--protein transferase [Marinomonas algicola]|uniref:leucyl/phenylalanyl-tRNA--protein transferase n=1 Tax=Marinomonas algicola TaxID=2773454 RepID=UPI00174D37A6|nr:leucyl/phenylalanyl-tRNA--protein transferase [Marinomonas algicola]
MTQQTEQKTLTLLNDSPFDIPIPHKALDDPDGLCAVGGDLSVIRLINMYQHGFFPWYSEPDPILWWHPTNRCVLMPSQFHLSRSMRKHLRKHSWEIKINTAFDEVMNHCSMSRQSKEGTWISDEIKTAYKELQLSGFAHSVEVWEDSTLIGGFYGVCIDHVFFGESMFSNKENASKTALYALCQYASDIGVELIDCQVESSHLLSLGAKLIDRSIFCDLLKKYCVEAQGNLALTNTKTISWKITP